MSKKLKNISAIKKMLVGKHHTQANLTVPLMQEEQKIDRKVGEVWFDKNGIEWEQRKGFVIQKGKLQELRNELLAKKMPTTCPKCSSQMKTKMDAHFWMTEKHCFNCQVAFEHKLRIEGKFEEYEQRKIRENALSWLKDAETEVEQMIDAISSEIDIANSDGTLEKWGGLDKEVVIKKIRDDFEEVKNKVLQL